MTTVHDFRLTVENKWVTKLIFKIILCLECQQMCQNFTKLITYFSDIRFSVIVTEILLCLF